MNVNSKLFVPEANVEKQKQLETTTPNDLTENADRVVSKRVDHTEPASETTKISPKELKVVIVKDLTLLIDRLLKDGSLCEKMALED